MRQLVECLGRQRQVEALLECLERLKGREAEAHLGLPQEGQRLGVEDCLARELEAHPLEGQDNRSL